MADRLASPRDAAGRWAQAVVAAVRACLRHKEDATRVLHLYRDQAAQLERRLELEAVCRKWRRNDNHRHRAESIGVWCHDVLERVQVVLAGGEDPAEKLLVGEG